MSALLKLALDDVGKFHDGQDVVMLAHEVAQAFPDLASYCALATPSTSWCGIFIARELSKLGIRPPYSPGNDVGSFMYVDSYAKTDWGGTHVEVGQEQPGDIICLSSPHHVTILKEVQGDRYICVGGNQSDGVTIASFARSGLMKNGIIRPPTAVPITKTEPATVTQMRLLILHGSIGPAVAEVQTRLGIAVDGEFGPDTDAAVRAFQASKGLDPDGEVGKDTWSALLGVPVTVALTSPNAEEYNAFWQQMVILPQHVASVERIARDLFANKARYQAAVAGTNVPWHFVAAIHQRESSADFSKNIHNGQALGQVTTIAPTGRGPFPSFEASVADWIKLKGLDQVNWSTVAQFAYQCERNNGMGYRNHGVPSAYLWSFSNIYKGGKYIADGVWSATTMDQQSGTMPILKELMSLDSSITFTTAVVEPDMPTETIKTDPVKTGTQPDWGGLITALLPLAGSLLSKFTSKPATTAPTTPALGGIDLSQIIPIVLPLAMKLLTGGASTAFDLDKILKLVVVAGQVAAAFSGQPFLATKPEPVLSPIDKVLGGEALVGWKTPIGILGLIASSLLQGQGVVGMPVGSDATVGGGLLTGLFGALTGLGITAKIDRATQGKGAAG